MSHSTSHTCCQHGCHCNRVLIVDDEPGILFAYRKLLEQQGMVVDSCDCLCEALEYLEKHHYLAVVADMRLQGADSRDGLDLVREVRRRQPAAGVIVASGTSDLKTRTSASELGVDHYLEKPVHPTMIMDLLIQLKNAVNGEELLPAPEAG
ncbi:response regulator [Trichlorobacter lovleyi]|uniref:response regulator n=1 Tax=Trichlorobacter lovleyi TaxID=313985 RepID=UPI003D0E5786